MLLITSKKGLRQAQPDRIKKLGGSSPHVLPNKVANPPVVKRV